jgi:hypothetical protein
MLSAVLFRGPPGTTNLAAREACGSPLQTRGQRQQAPTNDIEIHALALRGDEKLGDAI